MRVSELQQGEDSGGW